MQMYVFCLYLIHAYITVYCLRYFVFMMIFIKYCEMVYTYKSTDKYMHTLICIILDIFYFDDNFLN